MAPDRRYTTGRLAMSVAVPRMNQVESAARKNIPIIAILHGLVSHARLAVGQHEHIFETA